MFAARISGGGAAADGGIGFGSGTPGAGAGADRRISSFIAVSDSGSLRTVLDRMSVGSAGLGDACFASSVSFFDAGGFEVSFALVVLLLGASFIAAPVFGPVFSLISCSRSVTEGWDGGDAGVDRGAGFGASIGAD
jgi:hypothetical protein